MSAIEHEDYSELIKGVVDTAVGLSRRGLEPDAVVEALSNASDPVASGIAYASSATKNVNPDIVRNIANQLRTQD